MKSLNKNFLPVHVADDVYTKEEVYTKDEVDALIEEGGGGASGLVVNIMRDDELMQMYLDKNYNEIKTALLSGANVVIIYDQSDETAEYYNFHPIALIEGSEGEYRVRSADTDYIADSPTGRLIMNMD